MTPERWRQVTEVFHAARSRDAPARAEYLDHACVGDRTLREEVDAMLAAQSDAGQFGESPVNPPTALTRRLESGAMVGPYRIDRLIGAGGMGEVYRARDTRLGRDVAIKVLPALFLSDPERHARFEREARLLASLNHPHIGAIYGLEEADGLRGLVLELVDGPTLADRLTAGPLSVDEALTIARQIAEALEAAHEKGIVHRDLKPANIKITSAGVIKVLDFGLAKMYAAGPDLLHSPTITVGTRQGMILGTAAYMSPEQARGQAVDKRADIWAFGCVLYELLTGRPAFPGETISDTIAAILEREPNWYVLSEKTPASVQRLLQRCLEKDPRRRLHDIADGRIELEDALTTAPPSIAFLGNLPRPRTAFLGREQEIDDVEARLQQARLLTLTGAGGVGKTRLAVRVADDVAADYDDGVWFVDLAPLSDGALVARAVATVLGVREESNRSLVDTLCAYLAGKKLLLILDNCEHMVPACATFADTLLRSCSRLRLCATSRQALGVEGEIIWRVPSLSVPNPARLSAEEPSVTNYIMESEAVRLFVARAIQSNPDFHMTAGNARVVAEVCARLDGIPLAIELAAVRTKVLSVEQIAARLHDRFRLLTDGSRTAVPRQQTLRATLDWSHDLLGTKEQLFLRRLSSFTGGATLDAAEAVCSGSAVEPEDVLDLVTALIDRSLAVIKTPGGSENRYDLLETIRQYGQDRLKQSGEAVEVTGRHATFFLQLAIDAEPHLSGAEQAIWLGRLETEHNNLRAALTFFLEREPARALCLALALNTFWEVRAHFVEGRGWLERALEGSPDAPSVSRARAAGAAGRFAWYQEDHAAARALLEESLSLFEALDERRSAIVTLGSLGLLAAAEGDYVRARALCERAVAEARTLGDKQILASQLRDFKHVAGALFDLATARALDEEALALWRELGDPRGAADALIGLGYIDVYSGDALRARGRLLESLSLSRALGDSWLICGALYGLGHTDRALGDFTSAHEHYAQSLRLCRESNSNFGGPLFEAFAALAAAEGRVARAARLLGASEAFHEARRFPLLPFLRPEHDRAVATARAGLDPDAFATAWTEGRTMMLDQAVALALTTEE